MLPCNKNIKKEATKIKKMFKTVALVTVISCATRFVSFLFKIYLSRKVGAEILGLFQIASSLFVLLACFSSTGIPLTLSRKTAEKEASADFKAQNALFTASLISSVVIASGFCLFFTLGKGLLKYIFHDERCIYVFLWMLPALITTAIYGVIRGWFWGKKQFGLYSSIELIEELVKICATVFFICAITVLPTEQGLAAAMLVTDVICVALLIFLYFKKGGRLSAPARMREIAKSAAPITSSRIFTSLATSACALILPILLTKYGMSTAEATSAYGRASGMVMPLLFAPCGIVGALAVVMIPEMATLRTQNKTSQMSRHLNKALLFSCFVSAGFFALYAASGKLLGELLYKDLLSGEYVAAAAFIVVPMCMNQICTSTLNSLGFENKTFFSNIIGLILLLAGSFALPKFIGIYAMFAGLFIYHTITLVLHLVFLEKYANIGVSVLWQCFFVILASATSALLGGIISKALPQSLYLILRCIIVLLCVAAIFLAQCGIMQLLKLRLLRQNKSAYKMRIIKQ